jgi:acyl-homoserine lactone acylase PvdQ
VRGFRELVAALALTAFGFAAATANAATPQAYGTNDYGGFTAILPPGTNGLANILQLGQFEASGVRPAHNDDQYAPYANLVYAPPGLTAAQIPNYFHDATFGTPPGNVESTISPRPDVTIQRDNLGVPHVYGDTRAGAMFGLGYAAAQDRLFFMDVLRHAGRGELSSFAGGAAANRQMDEDVWADTPYTEDDLQRQCAYRPAGFEAQADQLHQDVASYIDGINQYISEARLDPTKMPGEYAAIGQPQGPTPWSCPDVVATASLIGGIFGKGGGRELDSALTYESARQKFGHKKGKKVFNDFRNADDPGAPTTVHKKRFPYETTPRKHIRGMALPDPGSVQDSQVVTSSSGGGGAGGPLGGILGPLGGLLNGGPLRSAASNALLVSARESQGGKPVVVMGPQVAYFAPQILMEEDVHAPTIDARGAAFPGVNLFVELGHGRDYAWSATSAGQDITDTFAVPLCDPGGGAASLSSNGYLFQGQCLPFEVLTRTNSWSPTLADQTPAGSETLTALRTKLGIVVARARVHGQPVVYTKLRSTYFHEVDSALGFSQFNNPDAIKGPRDFQRAANLINYTFNWFYADDKNIAYFNSGWNPVRAKHTDPNFPVSSKYLWRDFQPDSLSGRTAFPLALTPFKAHPQAINQNFFTSWNNKQARGYHAADDNWNFGPVFRSTALDERVKALIKGKRKASLPQLIEAMKEASTVDLDAHTVLPSALKIIRSKPITDPAVRSAVATLSAWVKSGAHRVDRNRDGHYDNSDAIRIKDAWWPSLIQSEFEPTLGKDLYDHILGMTVLDDSPHIHLGSAYDGGWYVYANKDLRTVLAKHRLKLRGSHRGHGKKGHHSRLARAAHKHKAKHHKKKRGPKLPGIPDPNSRVYCGGGKFGRCRAALIASLKGAINADPYPAPDSTCHFGDKQMCYDAIKFRATGAVTQPDMVWMNRPTFQQADQIQGHR